MLEALVIFGYVYACMLMPLRGKTYEQLSESQKRRVDINYSRYMRSLKGKKSPEMTVVDYLPILQKQGLAYLIMAIVLTPIYIVAVIYLYPTLFA